ncbi:histone deacetylation protein Rxt3-domain-containing protein [Terfezia claveryi]|nr:histone deacetylation protein Rxt3-domain-containing protein [Terfezia claveryi]
MEEAMSGQPVSKRGMMEKEEKEESIVGVRGRTKEKIEKERETEEEGPPSAVSMNTGKKRRHHVHVHHHHPPHHHHIHLHHAHDNDERFSLDGGPLHLQAQSIAQTNSKRAMTPVPHHHHPPRHHSPVPQPPAKRPKLIINSTPVVDSVANLTRYHLGSMVYNPSGNSNALNKGYSTTHSMLPRFEGRENCIFQIRIPRRYLYERERAEICKRRCLWGSDVYTDDSDVLAVLVHMGNIPPVLPNGIDPELVLAPQPGLMEDKDKEFGRKGYRAAATGKGKSVVNGSNIAVPPTASTDRINGALPAGTKSIPSGYLNINKDIIVDILILPPLEKYSSTVRNAIKSRSWTKQHDGMSYKVYDVKTAEPGEAEGRGKSMRKQRLNEREHIRKWGTLPGREGEGGLRTLVGREAKVGA